MNESRNSLPEVWLFLRLLHRNLGFHPFNSGWIFRSMGAAKGAQLNVLPGVKLYPTCKRKVSAG
jgi:hypothetical protein